MQYLLLCCFNEKAWDSIPEPERDSIMRQYGAWVKELERRGQHVSTTKLGPSTSAASVRIKNGRPMISDGPFAETKEQLGGYHLIECVDLNEAISIAERIPTLGAGGAIEVRPVESPL